MDTRFVRALGVTPPDGAAAATVVAGPRSVVGMVGVGYNPYRKVRRSPLDYVMVASALAVCAALVAWALLG